MANLESLLRIGFKEYRQKERDINTMPILQSQLQNSLRSNCGAKHAYLPIVRKVHRINAMHIYE